jgi:hypothetical protein
MTLALVRVIDRPTGTVVWSRAIDFAEPRSVIAVNSASGTVFKRVQATDTAVNIYISENTTIAPAVFVEGESDGDGEGGRL